MWKKENYRNMFVMRGYKVNFFVCLYWVLLKLKVVYGFVLWLRLLFVKGFLLLF